MSLAKRVRRLETRLFCDPIVLVFADGSTREIRYEEAGMLRLFMAALSGEVPNPLMRQHLDWIRHSVEYRDAGGGHMIDMIKQAMEANADNVCRTPPACLRPPQLGPIPGPPKEGV